MGLIIDKITGKLMLVEIKEADLESALQVKVNLISATYAELQELVNNNALKVGATYLLSDFCTKYNQPVTNDLKTEETEPLLLTAIDTNKFHNECKSTVYAFDIVYYDFNDNICEDGETERNGRITGRWDLENNNKLIGNDWRTVKYKRYTIDTAASNILAYDDDANYVIGDLVTASSNIYACVQNCTGETPESNEAYWLLLFENYATLPICLDTTGNLTKVYIKDVQKTLVGGGTGTDHLFFNGIAEFKGNDLILWNDDLSNYYINSVLINSSLYKNQLLTGTYFYYNTIINSDISQNIISGTTFYLSQILNSTINNNNLINSILKGFYNNSSIIYNSMIYSQLSNLNNKQFRFNNLINISKIDFSLSTHVFADCYCELAKNSDDVAYLRYCDADNVYQIVSPTE